MRFFGQTMASFATAWHDKENGIVLLFAPMIDRGKRIGETRRYIDVSEETNWKEIPKYQIESPNN